MTESHRLPRGQLRCTDGNIRHTDQQIQQEELPSENITFSERMRWLLHQSLIEHTTHYKTECVYLSLARYSMTSLFPLWSSAVTQKQGDAR